MAMTPMNKAGTDKVFSDSSYSTVSHKVASIQSRTDRKMCENKQLIQYWLQ